MGAAAVAGVVWEPVGTIYGIRLFVPVGRRPAPGAAVYLVLDDGDLLVCEELPYCAAFTRWTWPEGSPTGAELAARAWDCWAGLAVQ